MRVRNPLVSLLTAFLLRLRFPYLFAISLGLFLLNVIVPDPIPFLDELVLGLLAALLASLRTKTDRQDGQESRIATDNSGRKGGAS